MDESKSPTTTSPGSLPAEILALLALLFPGLGQCLTGARRLGLAFFLAITGLYFGGLWVSQLESIDPQEHDVALLVQMGAPLYTGLVYYYKFRLEPSRQFLRQDDRFDERDRVYDRRHDVGLLATSVAGLLNILVMFHAFDRAARRREESAPPETAPPMTTSTSD